MRVTIKHEQSKQKQLTDAIVCAAVCAEGHVEKSQQLLRTAWDCLTCDDVPQGTIPKPQQKQLPQHIRDFLSDKAWAAGSPGVSH